jgi:hypothetical protein
MSIKTKMFRVATIVGSLLTLVLAAGAAHKA